jgi:hypothetical protein
MRGRGGITVVRGDGKQVDETSDEKGRVRLREKREEAEVEGVLWRQEKGGKRPQSTVEKH